MPRDIDPEVPSWTEMRLATLHAAADRIVPPDEFPGAWDAGAGEYIRRLFETDLQHRLASFLEALDSLDAEAHSAFGASFHLLAPEQQDAILQRIESGNTTGAWSHSPVDFFKTLVQITSEGYYSDPSTGGNRNQISWRMIGYDPGAHLP